MTKLSKIIYLCYVLCMAAMVVQGKKKIGDKCERTPECGAKLCCGRATPDPTISGNTAKVDVLVCNTYSTQDVAFSDPNDATKIYTFFCNEGASALNALNSVMVLASLLYFTAY